MTSDEFENSTAPLKVVKTPVAREQGQTKPDMDALIAQIRAFLYDAPEDKPHEGYRYGELLSMSLVALSAQQEEIADLRNANSSLATQSICESSGTGLDCPHAPCNNCLHYQRQRAELAEAERDALRKDAERSWRWTDR